MVGVDAASCLKGLLADEVGTVAILGEVALLVAELADVILGSHVPCHPVTRWIAHDFTVVTGRGVRWVHGSDLIGVEGAGTEGIGIPFTVFYVRGHLDPTSFLL